MILDLVEKLKTGSRGKNRFKFQGSRESGQFFIELAGKLIGFCGNFFNAHILQAGASPFGVVEFIPIHGHQNRSASIKPKEPMSACMPCMRISDSVFIPALHKNNDKNRFKGKDRLKVQGARGKVQVKNRFRGGALPPDFKISYFNNSQFLLGKLHCFTSQPIY